MNASPSQPHPAEWPETQQLRDTGERSLPAGRHAFHKEHLMAQIRDDIRSARPAAPARQRNPFLRKAVLLPAVACALAGAVVGGYALYGGGDGDGVTPLATGPALTTQLGAVDAKGGPQLLDRVSLAAGSGDTDGPVVRDGQFLYIASKVASTYPKTVDDKTTVVSQELHPRQVWQSQDGKDGWLIEAGETSDEGITLAGPHAASSAYDNLVKLPTDPDALLRKIYQDARANKDKEVPIDQAAFVAIGDLLTESYPPAKLIPALYKAAAKIPGVVAVDDATDAMGRHGVAVARMDDQSGQREEWIFDKKSLKFLGDRTVQVKAVPDWPIKPGTVTSTSAITQRAVVDGNKRMPSQAG